MQRHALACRNADRNLNAINVARKLWECDISTNQFQEIICIQSTCRLLEMRLSILPFRIFIVSKSGPADAPLKYDSSEIWKSSSLSVEGAGTQRKKNKTNIGQANRVLAPYLPRN